MKILLSALTIFCGLFTTVNPTFAQIWTQTSAPITTWSSVASSADGTKLFAINTIFPPPFLQQASPLYISTNSGASWNPVEMPYFYGWNFVACSADGNKLAAAVTAFDLSPFLFWSSSDSGATWSVGGPYLGLYSGGWKLICCSADGSKLFALSSTDFYTSMDSGQTWTATSTSPIGWSCVASSANGTKVIAGRRNDTISASTNSGTTWLSAGPTNEYWWGGVASSADGCKLVAASFSSFAYNHNGIGGLIYTSADSGTTWTLTSAPFTNWQSVASSADGTKLVAAVNGGQIYTSNNSGITWSAADSPSTNWQCVASSADGSKLVAIAGGGGIWTSQTTPSPQLNIETSSTNLMFSWVISSMDFVLQQNADLTTTNWVTLTNEPVFNLTNLNKELIISPSNSSSFFRLISQ